MGLAIAASMPERSPLTISEDGVGPINGSTRFDRKAVQEHLPHLMVMKQTSMTEDIEIPVIAISDKQGLLATIYPDSSGQRIYSVVSESSRVSNRLGHKLGQTYKSVYAGKSVECVEGHEQESGTVFCPAPGSKHIGYQFYTDEEVGVDGQVPPLKVHNRWKIKAIFWRP